MTTVGTITSPSVDNIALHECCSLKALVPFPDICVWS